MGILETISSAKTVVMAVHDAETKTALLSVILDVQSECLRLQETIDKVRQEKLNLEEELAQIKKNIERRKQLRRQGDALIVTDDLGERLICPLCFEDKSRLFHLSVDEYGTGNCQRCNGYFNTVGD